MDQFGDRPVSGGNIPDPQEIEEDPMLLEEMDLQEDLEVPDPPDLDRLAETQHE